MKEMETELEKNQNPESRTQNRFDEITKNFFYFMRCMIVALVTGMSVDGVATLFSVALEAATDWRLENHWLVWLLPLSGLAITGVYYLAGDRAEQGTDLVIQSIRTGEALPGHMAPLVFFGTVMTHLCGGSSGREGAALQLGGAMGNMLVNVNSKDGRLIRVGVLCGMSAAFSALFGTPIAATVFALELASVGIIYYSMLAPCTLSALVASAISRSCGVIPESFAITGEIPEIDFLYVFLVIVLGALCALLSALFCICLHAGGALYRRFLPNRFIRIAAGGLLVALLAFLCNTNDYLGAGMHVITRAVSAGQAVPSAFILKLLFTVLTLGAGFKGGEIVPSFFVGATFGCFMGGVLGLPPAFSAALGMIALFCGVTNCPLASLLIAFELFGFIQPIYFLIIIAISYTLSGYYSLYREQKIVYGKLENVYVDHQTH